MDGIILGNTEDRIKANAVLKRYPDGSGTLLVADRNVFRIPGWEERFKKPRAKAADDEDAAAAPDEEEARRKARARLRDIARSNSFTWFLTLTLDARRIDRYDAVEAVQKLSTWCDNRVRRKGLTYLFVAEHHKDGAVHFHGLINEALDADMKPSGHTDGDGHEVFNLASWKLGFSTAIKLYGSYNKAVAYVAKYIGKESEKIGGRWYYSGGDLKRPTKEHLEVDFDAVDGYTFELSRLGATVKIVDIEGPGDYTA